MINQLIQQREEGYLNNFDSYYSEFIEQD